MTRFFPVFLLLAFLNAPGTAMGAGDAQAGKAAYMKSCASCHGEDGAPKPSIEKMMKVDMQHLGAPAVQALSDEEHRKIIMEGTGKMKPTKGLSDAQANDIIAYVRTLSEK
jgi:mono/diheme cytochrome c family protein